MRAPAHFFERLSLRNKLIFSFVFVIIISTVISSFVSHYKWKQDYYAQVREEGTVLTQTLAQGAVDPILRHDFSTLEEYVNNLLKKENVAYVIFTNHNGHILAGGDQDINVPAGIIQKGLANTAPALVQTYHSAALKMQVNDVSVPVMIDGKKWGTVRVGFSLGNVEHEIYSNILSALLSALLSIAGGIAVALVLTRIITKPVGTFIKSMRTISEGDLSQKIEVSSPDEFGQMADSFNRMAHSLSESKVKLKETFEELAQKQKLAALGELSARVAHEIKNPLGIIRGSAQIIVDGKTSLEIKEEVGRFIVEETDKLNHTVMDILNYAQPRMRELVAVDLSSLIKDNRMLWEKAAAEKGKISLQLRLAEGLPEVNADRDLVLRALLNIVMNACEAAEDGGEVAINTFSKDTNWIAVSVLDNGPGIDGPGMDKIFEPFFTTKKNGTGLGLSIVRSIVESHNGRVTAENREEGGTSVTIYFPLVNADLSR
jgi:signal transduction histidine kinase